MSNQTETINCIFCKIVNNEIPSARVYEDNDFLSFLDIAPANKGHVLVIPKKHYATLTDLPEHTTKDIHLLVQKIAKAVYLSTNADGYNCFDNNHPFAGQVVPHFHMHIVPRHKDDGIIFDWPHHKYAEGEMKEYGEKIKKMIK